MKVYKGKLTEYQTILDSLEFFKEVFNLEKARGSQLESILNQKKDSINLLSSNIYSREKDLAEYNHLFNLQKDTTNLLQKYLNVYIVAKMPIKEKHKAKVYLPEGRLFLPEDKKAIKEIKSLNKEYKKDR